MKTNSFFSKKLYLLFGLMLCLGIKLQAQRPDTSACVGTTINYHLDATYGILTDSVWYEYVINYDTFYTNTDTTIALNTSTDLDQAVMVNWTEFTAGVATVTNTSFYYVELHYCLCVGDTLLYTAHPYITRDTSFLIDSIRYEYAVDGDTFSTLDSTNIVIPITAAGPQTIHGNMYIYGPGGMSWDTFNVVIEATYCSLNLGPDVLACIEGSCVNLRDLSIIPSLSYTWFIDGMPYSSANDTSFCPTSIGSYQVICYGIGGGSVSSDTMYINAESCMPNLGNDTILCTGSGTCITLHSGTTISSHSEVAYTLRSFMSAYYISSGADSFQICATPISSVGVLEVECVNHVLVSGVLYEYADTILITVISCDSVWPGDADYDGIANNYDVLALGIAYGSTGSVRSAADNLWYGHYAPFNFSNSFLDGINYKNADCNGDGTVDGLDTVAIINNYGLSHARGTSSVDTISPDIYVDYDFDTIVEGAYATGSIVFGNGADINAYGLALSLAIDTDVININTFNLDFSSSWLTSGDVALNVVKRMPTQIDFAHTGTNHVNKAGHGIIAHFSCFIQDNISGKVNAELFKLFRTDIRNEKVVLADGTPVAVTVNGDKAYAKYLSSGMVHNLELENSISVYPNPTSNLLNINFAKNDHYQIHLEDELGSIVTKDVVDGNKITLDISRLSGGVYFLKIESSNGIAIKKIIKN